MAKQIKYKILQELPLTIIGLVTTETDLKISWAINQSLHIHLARKENVVNNANKKLKLNEFAFYSFEDEHRINYSLLANKSNGSFFLDEFKSIDLFLFIKGNMHKDERNDLIQNIRKLKEVTTSIAIEPNKINKPERLDFI